MEISKIEWFKKKISPILVEYDVTFRYFKDGDFGHLVSSNLILLNLAEI